MSKKEIIFKAISIILLILVLEIICFFAIFKIIYPAHLSTVGSCVDNSEEFLNEKGYQTQAITLYDPKTNNVSIIYYEIDKVVVKHEHVHRVQAEQGRIWGCDHIKLKYLNELEAYTFQYFPDFLYNKIYGYPNG